MNFGLDARRRRLHRLRLRGPVARRVRPDRRPRWRARGQPARQDDPLEPKRPILDRNGQAFAVSSRAKSLFAHLPVDDRGYPRAAPGTHPRRLGAEIASASTLAALRLRQRRLPPTQSRRCAISASPRSALSTEHAPVSQPRARRPRGGFEGMDGKGRPGRAGVGRALAGTEGRALVGRMPRPRDAGAPGDRRPRRAGVMLTRRHAAVHRGEVDAAWRTRRRRPSHSR